MTIGESYHEALFWFCGNLKGNHIFPHFSIQCRVCVIHALNVLEPILAKIGLVSPMLWMAPQKRANFWSCRCVVELANPHATTLHQCKTPHDQQLFGSTQMNFKSWSHTWTTLRNQHEGELGNLKDLKRDQETKRQDELLVQQSGTYSISLSSCVRIDPGSETLYVATSQGEGLY